MRKLVLDGGRGMDSGHHNYSLPFPFSDNEFSEIELVDFDCFSEEARLDVFTEIIRVLEPNGAVRFSADARMQDIIAEGFDCMEQDGVVRCIHKTDRVAATAKDITEKYYDAGYFVTDGKTYAPPIGKKLGKWSYRNPRGLWHVTGEFVDAWKKVFAPTCVIDVGCGRGTFVKSFEDVGIAVKGYDFSEFAVKYAVCSPENIAQADANNLALADNISDLTLVLDLMEHIYADEVDAVLSEIARISKKWVFFNLGGLVTPGNEKMLKRGELIPQGYEGLVAAGHVTFQTKRWWLEKMEMHGLKVKEDLGEMFTSLIPNAYLVGWEVVVAEKNDLG